jgi:hypothetical protein
MYVDALRLKDFDIKFMKNRLLVPKWLRVKSTHNTAQICSYRKKLKKVTHSSWKAGVYFQAACLNSEIKSNHSLSCEGILQYTNALQILPDIGGMFSYSQFHTRTAI